MTTPSETYYERYPYSILGLSLGQLVICYLLGSIIFFLIIDWLGLVYLALCLISLLVAMRLRCSYCWYYGKRCPSALGKFCKFFFKKRSTEEFQNPRNVAPTAMLSFGVLVLPIGGSLILLIDEFSWLVFLLLFLYIVVAGFSGYFLRKELLCRHCKQGQIGCPAYEGMKGKGGKERTVPS